MSAVFTGCLSSTIHPLMNSSNNSNSILCPECEAVIRLAGKPRTGQRFSCRRCQTSLIIRGTKPLEIEFFSAMQASSGSETKSHKKKGHSASTRPADNPEIIIDQQSTNTAICPECQDPIQLNTAPKLRQAVVCANCDEVLQVISLKPLRLEIVDEDYWD